MASYNKVILAALCVLAVTTLSQAHPQFTQGAQQFAQPGFAAGQAAETGFRRTVQDTTFQEGFSGSTGRGQGLNSNFGFNG